MKPEVINWTELDRETDFLYWFIVHLLIDKPKKDIDTKKMKFKLSLIDDKGTIIDLPFADTIKYYENQRIPMVLEKANELLKEKFNDINDINDKFTNVWDGIKEMFKDKFNLTEEDIENMIW